jgi:hypothetical protein
MATRRTAFAQHGDLHPPETSEDDAAVGAIGVQGRVLTGRALGDLGLGVKGGQAERLTHRTPPGVENRGFHLVHIGGCGEVNRQRYCNLHEKSPLVIWIQHPPP